MGSTRLVAVLGLGFGDCGKGLFVDYLCRRLNAHTVVRFNGGGQAGHNVVLPDGRHHTFSQFGSGSFAPGKVTLLAYPVIVHPTALLVENEYLRRAGVGDALARLVIDGRCRVTTPFHQAAGRMRELERGTAAHGTCGAGVGETVRHSLDRPEQAMLYADLERPGAALRKLEAIRHTLRSGFERHCSEPANEGAYQAELKVLDDPAVCRRWLDQVRELARHAAPAARETVAARLHLPGTVVFEGAQGILLDEWHGFHPHTTWSSTGTGSAQAVAADAGQLGRIEHFGALRTYLTRHGNGPLPTHDRQLDGLAEPHNSPDGWQGHFRRGHPDALLLRYALRVTGKLDGLLVSHLDVFERGHTLKRCSAYAVDGGAAWDGLCHRDQRSGLVTDIVPSAGRDLAHQAQLAHLLAAVRPCYESRPIARADQFIGELEALADVPVLLGSHGPTHGHVMTLRPLVAKSSR
jgi:adenylosuccinate synthase